MSPATVPDLVASDDRRREQGDRLRVVHIDPCEDYRLLVRLALRPAIDVELVAGAAGVVDGTALAARHHPDVVLVEPYAGSGIEAAGLGALARACGGAHLVLLTSLPSEEVAWPAAVAGARGRLSKRVPPTRLAFELHELVGVLEVVAHAVEEARTRLDADLLSPRRARQFVAETLERWQCRDAAMIIDLLVSEIVANAVLHAQTPAELSVHLLPDRVRVSVVDGDPSHPKRRPPDPSSSSGRGLALIERLSLAWGIDRVPAGKRVWFETPRPDAPVADASGAEGPPA